MEESSSFVCVYMRIHRTLGRSIIRIEVSPGPDRRSSSSILASSRLFWHSRVRETIDTRATSHLDFFTRKWRTVFDTFSSFQTLFATKFEIKLHNSTCVHNIKATRRIHTYFNVKKILFCTSYVVCLKWSQYDRCVYSEINLSIMEDGNYNRTQYVVFFGILRRVVRPRSSIRQTRWNALLFRSGNIVDTNTN